MKPLKLAIDFDGTCTKHDYPRLGETIEESVRVLKRLADCKHLLILYTMRSGKELEDAIKWFKDNGIMLYGVQKDPTQNNWTISNKCYANIYIDDAALGCPLIYPKDNSRPYVDWIQVEKELEKKGILW